MNQLTLFKPIRVSLFLRIKETRGLNNSVLSRVITIEGNRDKVTPPTQLSFFTL